MKKIILGTILAFAFATGMGDAEAGLVHNKSDTKIALNAAYLTPIADAQFVCGIIQDLLYIANANPNYKADRARLKKILIPFERITKKESLSRISSAINKANIELGQLSAAFRGDANVQRIFARAKAVINGRVILQTGGVPTIEPVYSSFANALNVSATPGVNRGR